MTRYYITTDSASIEIVARTPAAAVKEFMIGEGPRSVSTPKRMELWLERIGGYGLMRNEDTGEVIFDVKS